jgi:benzylsuccinate CoA-transferase BbsF subunit
MAHSPAAAYAPLAAFTVIEAAQSLTAAYCGRILADLGAQVFRSSTASTRPLGDTHDAVSDEIAAYLHHGKAVLVPGTDSSADLLICDGQDVDGVRSRAVVCITPFGAAAPKTPTCELALQHASGFAYHQAMPVSDPEVLPPRASADREAVMAAGVGAALASIWSLLVERDVVVDFSICDFLSHLLIEPVHLTNEPRPPVSRRRAPGQAIAIAGGLVWLLSCADGNIMISPREDHQWKRWIDVMGNPAWASQTDLCGSRDVRTRNTARLQELMSVWTRQHTCQEVFAITQKARIACCPVSRPIDLIEMEQLEHRGFYDHLYLNEGRIAKVPGLPFRMRDSAGAELPRGRKIDARSRLDSAGTHERSYVTGPSARAHASGGGRADPAATAKDALAGVRIVDFSWVMAGPLCTKMLGAMGAEVIKIESSTRPEFKNRSGWFDILNNSKRSCTIDITSAAGQSVLHKLVAVSDVLIENFSAGVLAKHGLSYEELQRIRPSLVYVSASGLGRTGPLRDALAYGTLLQAFSGRSALVGTPNPSLEAMGVLPAWTDPITAFWEAVSITAALVGTRRTGRGAFVDLSMLEGTIALLPESLLSAQGIGPAPADINAERAAAPCGCFRCCDDDGWLALSVLTDHEWIATCRALGIVGVEADGRFDSAAARRRHKTEVNAMVGVALRKLSSFDAERRLQAVDVPASRSRHIFEIVDAHDRSGSSLFPRMPGGRRTIAMPWTDQIGWRGRIVPGPALGADTDWVLSKVLGLTKNEIDDLKAGAAAG